MSNREKLLEMRQHLVDVMLIVDGLLKPERAKHQQSSNPSNIGNIQFPQDPVANTLADLVTTRQLGLIRAIARENQLDADVECFEVMRCKTSELSRKAASALIDHLNYLAAMPNSAR